MAKSGGSVFNTILDPLNLSGNRPETQNPQQANAFNLGVGQESLVNNAIGNYMNWLNPNATKALSMVDPTSALMASSSPTQQQGPLIRPTMKPGGTVEPAAGGASPTGTSRRVLDPYNSENQLWDLTAQRYLEQLTPKLSGSGVLTSGPGLNAMSQGLQDLSTQFTDQMTQRYLQTLFGLGSMEAEPIAGYSGGVSPLLGSAGSGYFGPATGGGVGVGPVSIKGGSG